jgi:hypothetical protein
MTPTEWAALPAAARVADIHRRVARLRAEADALHAAGLPGSVALGQAARSLQGLEAAWRAADGACCDRRAVGRGCECEVGL